MASQKEEGVVGSFRSFTQQVDLVELCAPWDSPLFQAVEDLGGIVVRLGPHNGYLDAIRMH